VTVFNGTNTLQMLTSFYVYTDTFAGGVCVACADVKRVGFADIITAPSPETASLFVSEHESDKEI
jgi:hypothetical protein